MIDLLLIPGSYRGPDEILPFGGKFTQEMRLNANGEAGWRFHDGTWSSSGHWKIVQGFHLSVAVIWDNAAARAQGEYVVQQYWHLVAVDNEVLVVRNLKGENETWNRCGGGPA